MNWKLLGIYLTLLISAILFDACENSVSSKHTPVGSLKLEQIYQDSSIVQMENYLTNWANESLPVSVLEEAVLSDTVRHVYQIFRNFYYPFDLERYSADGSYGPEVGKNFYSGINNLVVQNKIFYIFGDKYEDRREVTNFRPNVSFPGKRVLYISERYKTEIDSFLVWGKPDLQSRFSFINGLLKVVPRHWGGWHYITHPEVNFISFNRGMDTAVVHFRIVYEGGESVYVRENGKWRMSSSKLTWIE